MTFLAQIAVIVVAVAIIVTIIVVWVDYIEGHHNKRR